MIINRQVRLFCSTIVVLLGLSFSTASLAQGDWIIRTNISNVSPDVETNALGLDINSDTAISTDITYFFTPNIAINVVAIFTSHEAESTACNVAGSNSCGNIDLLPPIITGQWHFIPNGNIRPYVSAGINYNIFGDTTGTLDAINTKIDDTIGYAIGAGVDFGITNALAINLDIKQLYIEADVTTDLGNDKFDIDPLVIGAGIAYSF